MSATPPEHRRWLDRIALTDDDLAITITTDEIRALAHVLEALGIEYGYTRLVHRFGSPWVEADTVPAERVARPYAEIKPGDPAKVVRLALWRYTLAVYRVAPDGAVEDDPVWVPPGYPDRHEAP